VATVFQEFDLVQLRMLRDYHSFDMLVQWLPFIVGPIVELFFPKYHTHIWTFIFGWVAVYGVRNFVMKPVWRWLNNKTGVPPHLTVSYPKKLPVGNMATCATWEGKDGGIDENDKMLYVSYHARIFTSNLTSKSTVGLVMKWLDALENGCAKLSEKR